LGRKSRSLRLPTIASFLFVSACAAPGTPPLQAASEAFSTPVASDCQQVSPKARLTVLKKDSYFTTYKSILGEIGMQAATETPRTIGASVGAAIGGSKEPYSTVATSAGARAGGMVADALQDFGSSNGRRLNRLSKQPRAFCRSFEAERARVARSVGLALKSLGYPIKRADMQAGVFETDFVDSQNDIAMWVDRYRITVEPLENGYTAVRVRRQVFISRDTADNAMGTIYNQGASSGHGETWIITRITDELAGRPNASTISDDR